MNNQIKEKVKKHPIITAVISLIISLFIIIMINDSTMNLTPGATRIVDIIGRAVLSVVMLGLMVIVGGKKTISYGEKTISRSLKYAWYAILINFILFLLTVKGLFGNLSETWFSALVGTILLCIVVGIFEEALFRGIIFNALLAKRGDTTKGIMWAAIISSIIFGFVHVISFYINGGSLDFVSTVQSILKTIQTGMVGFFLAAVYLKTKSIWGVALIHGLNDFLLMVVSEVTNNSGGAYIATGNSAIINIVSYVAVILVSIPFVIQAKKITISVELPERGIFN